MQHKGPHHRTQYSSSIGSSFEPPRFSVLTHSTKSSITDGQDDSSVQKVMASSASVSLANFNVSFHMSLLTLFLNDVVRKSFHQSSHGVLALDHLMADRGEAKRRSQKAIACSRAACFELPAFAMVKAYL